MKNHDTENVMIISFVIVLVVAFVCATISDVARSRQSKANTAQVEQSK